MAQANFLFRSCGPKISIWKGRYRQLPCCRTKYVNRLSSPCPEHQEAISLNHESLRPCFQVPPCLRGGPEGSVRHFRRLAYRHIFSTTPLGNVKCHDGGGKALSLGLSVVFISRLSLPHSFECGYCVTELKSFVRGLGTNFECSARGSSVSLSSVRLKLPLVERVGCSMILPRNMEVPTAS